MQKSPKFSDKVHTDTNYYEFSFNVFHCSIWALTFFSLAALSTGWRRRREEEEGGNDERKTGYTASLYVIGSEIVQYVAKALPRSQSREGRRNGTEDSARMGGGGGGGGD